MTTGRPARVVALASGSGSTLQALLDACADPGYGVAVVAVGSDRPAAAALRRASAAGIETFVVAPADFADRPAWDAALTRAVSAHAPDLVLSAGFLRLVGPTFLAAHGARLVNTHPSLLPAFPGLHAVRDALGHGVKVTGATLFLVDAGVDTGPIVDQRAVPVQADDDEDTLHERIKGVEREMLVDVVGRMARDGWTVSGRRVELRGDPG